MTKFGRILCLTRNDVKNAAHYRLRHRYREDLGTRLSCSGCKKKSRTFHSFLGALLCFLGRFPIHTDPTPPLTPRTMLDACIQNFFRVSTLDRVRGGRTARKFRKVYTVLRGNREMTEKYEYCSTVPRTFVQDCVF